MHESVLLGAAGIGRSVATGMSGNLHGRDCARASGNIALFSKLGRRFVMTARYSAYWNAVRVWSVAALPSLQAIYLFQHKPKTSPSPHPGPSHPRVFPPQKSLQQRLVTTQPPSRQQQVRGPQQQPSCPPHHHWQHLSSPAAAAWWCPPWPQLSPSHAPSQWAQPPPHQCAWPCLKH